MDSEIRPCAVELCSRESDAVIDHAELYPGTLRRLFYVCPAHYQRMVAKDDWFEHLILVWDDERLRWRQSFVVRFRDGTDGLGGGGYAAY